MRKLEMHELGRKSAEEFKETKKNPVVVILDNVRSMNNVGSAFRTSDAFAIEKLYLCGITARPPHRDIQKTALGAQDTVTWEHFEETTQAIEKLKEEGYTIVCVEQVTDSVMLNDFEPDFDKKYAFIFGHEAFGVDEKVVECSDMALEIPQFGTKHSLNISVTMGVVLWHYMNASLSK
ncbi:RNA methyltransferase [Sediminitomix flava]|uniref:SpoU rRNA methylase family protein n=1 Tax=Sediminitomix flava TaxID=379075 RepID=A0A315Z2N4_SEDFL|nr:RNA methyltransferase [Sediminitomix flava]PWJ36046.1 SpoU rRNA methylase family protein [Sediminitomix flava]